MKQTTVSFCKKTWVRSGSDCNCPLAAQTDRQFLVFLVLARGTNRCRRGHLCSWGFLAGVYSCFSFCFCFDGFAFVFHHRDCSLYPASRSCSWLCRRWKYRRVAFGYFSPRRRFVSDSTSVKQQSLAGFDDHENSRDRTYNVHRRGSMKINNSSLQQNLTC